MKDEHNQIVMESLSRRAAKSDARATVNEQIKALNRQRITILCIAGHNLKADEIHQCEKRFHTSGKHAEPYLWVRFKNNMIQTFNYPSELSMLRDYKKIINFLDKQNRTAL